MRALDVLIDFGGPAAPRLVGKLIEDGPRLVFGYDASFIADPLPVSPVHLPVRAEVYEHAERGFERLPGLLFDALPDGWGRLLQDRAFSQFGIADRVTPVDRLAAVGGDGIGALIFRPTLSLGADTPGERPATLSELAANARRISMEGAADDVLPELMVGGGSPGGARPKVLVAVRLAARRTPTVIAGAAAAAGIGHERPDGFTPWIIKFPAREEGADAGVIEAAYAELARTAGIDVPRTHLFAGRGRQRFFGIERFDRPEGGQRRVHHHTLGGLLHADYRLPSCDYRNYIELTMALTQDMRAVKEAVRRMAFNVLAHNRDDHARNFAFLMDATGEWRLSPAYDLTFSPGPNGHHTTSVAGEALHPTMRHLLTVAEHGGLSAKTGRAVIEEVEDGVARWAAVAKRFGVSASASKRIAKALAEVRRAG